MNFFSICSLTFFWQWVQMILLFFVFFFSSQGNHSSFLFSTFWCFWCMLVAICFMRLMTKVVTSGHYTQVGSLAWCLFWVKFPSYNHDTEHISSVQDQESYPEKYVFNNTFCAAKLIITSSNIDNSKVNVCCLLSLFFFHTESSFSFSLHFSIQAIFYLHLEVSDSIDPFLPSPHCMRDFPNIWSSFSCWFFHFSKKTIFGSTIQTVNILHSFKFSS